VDEAEALCRRQVVSIPEKGGVAEHSGDACKDLHACVHARGLHVDALAAHALCESKRERHRRVEVGTADATEGVGGNHQHASDGDAAPDRIATQHIATQGEDQQKGADKLAGELGGVAGGHHLRGSAA